MNKHLASTIELYERNKLDLQGLITWHLCHGVVVCDNDSFALCYYSDSSNPEEAVLYQDSNTLFVTICTGNMRKALTKFLHDFDYISFQRDFKQSPNVRVYDILKFYKKLKQDDHG